MRDHALIANAKSPARANSKGRPPLCGIVLAGGEGKRLRGFVHLLRRDLLPKQYVNFIGRRSMLEHTLNRVEQLIPAERIFTVVNQDHLELAAVREQLAKRPPHSVIVQPENKETAAGLLLPLMHIAKRHPRSMVAVFPSDHFILEEFKFMRYVELASLIVEKDPSRLVLLGIPAGHAESGYGYILPENISGADALRGICCFIEKPDLQTAGKLLRAGALWNTMVMVFQTDTLLQWMEKLLPALHTEFCRLYDAIGTAAEADVLREIYAGLTPINFSTQILEPIARSAAARLGTLAVENVLWSDWGTERGIMEVLRKTGYLPRLNGLSQLPFDQIMAAHRSHRDIDNAPERRASVRRKNIAPRAKVRAARAVPRNAV